VLDKWFHISDETQEDKIFDAASVLIEADPSIWDATPPGMDYFSKELIISK
jgi:hypothetical protein